MLEMRIPVQIPLVPRFKVWDRMKARGIWNIRRDTAVIIIGERVSPAPFIALPKTMERAIKRRVIATKWR